MPEIKEQKQRYWLHLLLFVITFITTTLAGAEHANYPFSFMGWVWGGEEALAFFGVDETGFHFFMGWEEFKDGMLYSVPFLLILSCHEFGHYFTARYYNIKTSLPYYIPVWLPFHMFWIGTMGAVIRLRSATKSTIQFFDVGIAGPLAGWVVAMCFIIYGFANLPTKDYLLEVNPEYKEAKAQYGEGFDDKVVEQHINEGREPLQIGQNLTFWFFENYVVSDKSRVPNHYDIIHYPFLFAGFLALFFTALNLLPIGQLDGGHILYGLVGRKRSHLIATGIFMCFVFYAGLGLEFISYYEGHEGSQLLLNCVLYGGFLFVLFRRVFAKTLDAVTAAVTMFASHFLLDYFFHETVADAGYSSWLFFSFILTTLLGVHHPGAQIEQPLDKNRKILGWIALGIFIISFSPKPFIL